MTRPSVLISGATSGIGHAAAVLLAQQGCAVFAGGRHRQALEELGKIPGVIPIELEVTSAQSIEAARAGVAQAAGHLDVLVNNAGYGLNGPLEHLAVERVRQQFEVNVFGLHALTAAFLPMMRRRGSGRIIHVGSVAGRIALPFYGPYCATKFAVRALADALRMEARRFGIHVALVEPGVIATPFGARALEQSRALRVEDRGYQRAYERYDSRRHGGRGADVSVVARAIAHAALSPRPRWRYVVPWWYRLALAAHALTPASLMDAALRKGSGL